MTRYDLAYLALTPVALPGIVYKRIAHGKYRESLPGMFGRNWQPEERWAHGSLWVHAVSVGECVAAKALLPLLRRALPELPCVLTTVTETGQATARSIASSLADAITYYPADFSWVVARFLDVYRPRIFVIMETELWPNAIEQAASRGSLVVLANGRISEKSFTSYRRLRSVFRRPLGRIGAFCMQSADDAQRIVEIGAPPERVHVTGNCKFDVPYAQPDAAQLAHLRDMLGIPPGAPLIVVGSTHPGEEEIALEAFRRVRERFRDARLVIVPRHPERFDAVWQQLKATNFVVRRVSDGAQNGGPATAMPDVVLVDRMGLLTELYALATVALVAGSFVPGIGGHNLLEAAIHGVPVVYGPHMHKQPELTRILSPAQGGIVADRATLGDTLAALLADPDLRWRHGELVRTAACSQQGAARKTVEIITSLYEGRADHESR